MIVGAIKLSGLTDHAFIFKTGEWLNSSFLPPRQQLPLPTIRQQVYSFFFEVYTGPLPLPLWHQSASGCSGYMINMWVGLIVQPVSHEHHLTRKQMVLSFKQLLECGKCSHKHKSQCQGITIGTSSSNTSEWHMWKGFLQYNLKQSYTLISLLTSIDLEGHNTA